MKPGLEADRIIAERVYGWTGIIDAIALYGQRELRGYPKDSIHTNGERMPVPKYTTEDLPGMHRLMKELGMWLTRTGGKVMVYEPLEKSPGDPPIMMEEYLSERPEREGKIRVIADTIDEAICEAVIKKIGVTTDHPPG